MSSHPLAPRIHVYPGTFARSPGHISERFSSPTAAIQKTLTQLQRLPEPLVRYWLAAPGGYVVLNASRHAFDAGLCSIGRHERLDVAWLRLTLLVDDAVRYFVPLGQLIIHLLGGEQATAPESPLLSWEQLQSGVKSCFHSGYGRSVPARQQIDIYLAEGIATFLVDRRSLNIQDPRLEKLLSATLFNSKAYR